MIMDQESSTAIRQLSEEQLSDFGQAEYFSQQMFDDLYAWMDGRVGDRPFKFLDLGGGAGKFADTILGRFPNSTGVVLDNSSFLLNQNQVNGKKTLIEADIDDLTDVLGDDSFDFVFLNWVLHHCVVDGYFATRQKQHEILQNAAAVLIEGGHVVVSENLPKGMITDGLCTFLINRLTSSTVLAPMLRKRRVNTAGIGVCYVGKTQWERTFKDAGLCITGFWEYKKWNTPLLERLCLTMRFQRKGLFVLHQGACADPPASFHSKSREAGIG